MSNIASHIGQRMMQQKAQQQQDSIAAGLRSKCRAVEADERIIGVYSTGEVCAVALIMNDLALLPTGYSALDAVHRIGPEWYEICRAIQRDGWAQP